MNPLVKALSGIFILINKLISSIDRQILITIKRAYFFLIFILMLAGIYVGYKMGHESARIKDPPIAESMKDLFTIEMNREKQTGNFTKMLESRALEELPYTRSGKIHFPAKEEMLPEKTDAIIEPGLRSGETEKPLTIMREKPIEGDYTEEKRQPLEVTPLDRPETRENVEEKAIEPAQEQRKLNTEQSLKNQSTGQETRDLKEHRAPAPIIRDRGLLEK